MTTAVRCFIAAGVGASSALLLLLIHVLVPSAWLQLVAVWIFGGSLLCVWVGILTWRMPVLSDRLLLLVAASWAVGTALSVWLAAFALPSHPLVWRLSAQWVALALSFVAGAFLLRALLRKRTAPAVGRLISLISPLVVLLVILFSFLQRSA